MPPKSCVPKSCGTKRKRSPSPPPAHVQYLTPTQKESRYDAAVKMYNAYFMHLKHEYNTNTGLLNQVTYQTNEVTHSAETAESLDRLSNRIAFQSIHIYDILRFEFLHTHHLIDDNSMMTDRDKLVKSIAHQEYTLFGQAMENFQRFAAAYLYYYLVNFSDYNQTNLVSNSRQFLFQIGCALHRRVESCDTNIITRHTQYPAQKTNFDIEHDKFDQTIYILIQRSKQISDINRSIEHNIGSDAGYSVGSIRPASPRKKGGKHTRTRINRNKRRTRTRR
jgi:hypothetical protein